MLGFLRWIISVLFAAIVIVFVLTNRVPVPITWSPIHPPYEIPVFAPVLAGLALGFIFGALIVWLGEAPVRRERRRQRKTIKKLEQELETAKETPATDASSTALLSSQSKET